MQKRIYDRLPETQDFRIKNEVSFYVIYISVGLVISLACALLGFLISRYVYPNYVTKIETEYIETKSPPEIIYSSEKNLIGILEFEDGVAKTIRYKRAAIGNKDGFYDLKDDVPYEITQYFNYNDNGYGIVKYGENEAFLLIWHNGATKAPLNNPGAIKISASRIEISAK